MSRRRFLTLLPAAASSLLSACAAPALPASTKTEATSLPRRKIRAICFDLFTLFDPRGVIERARSVLPSGAEQLCEVWRTRQFEYSWLRSCAEQYRDFEQVTADALTFAARVRGVELTAIERKRLVDAYSELSPWPDTREQLTAFRARGLKLAPLANYAPGMIARLLSHSGLSEFFDDQISTDAARAFKPAPEAYALGPVRLGLEREEIVFSAFGSWDAAGAKWFGFPTFWVNRLGVVGEELVVPDGTGPTLAELASFIAERPA